MVSHTNKSQSKKSHSGIADIHTSSSTLQMRTTLIWIMESLYSEAPKTQRSVWRTERKNVRFDEPNTIVFGLYYFVRLLV